jgi:hypothetical protein
VSLSAKKRTMAIIVLHLKYVLGVPPDIMETLCVIPLYATEIDASCWRLHFVTSAEYWACFCRHLLHCSSCCCSDLLEVVLLCLWVMKEHYNSGHRCCNCRANPLCCRLILVMLLYTGRSCKALQFVNDITGSRRYTK